MTARIVFVISPIGAPGSVEHRRYWLTLEYVIKKAFDGDEWTVVRADEEASPDSITTQVIGRIVNSDIVVADLTDHNPNVFYELAVAHGYQKPVVHMMQTGQKVPFDVIDQRVIFYDLADPESVDKARRSLRSSIDWLNENPGQSRNPLSAFDQFAEISSASDGGEAVALALQQLTRQVSRIEARQRVSSPYGVTSQEDDIRWRLDAIRRERSRLLARRRAAEEAGEELLDPVLTHEMQVMWAEEQRLRSLLEEREVGPASGELG